MVVDVPNRLEPNRLKRSGSLTMSAAMTSSNPQSPELKRRVRRMAALLGLVALSFFFGSLYLFAG